MSSNQRVEFSTWGVLWNELTPPLYAVRTDRTEHLSDVEVAVAAIERKSGLIAITTASDGCAVSPYSGKVTNMHYRVTLGLSCNREGWTPKARIGVAIPVGQESSGS